MKLYTEKEVINATTKVFLESITFEDVNEVMRGLTPIELPSDEEISKESMDLYGVNSTHINDILQYKAFKRGAKWMRDKIQGGNK
jgi:hypothetical protein